MVRTASLNCAQCTYISSKKYNLRRHMTLKHCSNIEEQIEKHKCVRCAYETKLKSDLKSHLLYRHTDSSHITWFNCLKCKFKAKTKTDLKRHNLHRHANAAGIKWHHCLECAYKSKTAVNLKRHVNCMHGSGNNKQEENSKRGLKTKNNRKRRCCENKIDDCHVRKKKGDEAGSSEHGGIKKKGEEAGSSEVEPNIGTQVEDDNGGGCDKLDIRGKNTEFDTEDNDEGYKISGDGFTCLRNLY